MPGAVAPLFRDWSLCAALGGLGVYFWSAAPPPGKLAERLEVHLTCHHTSQGVSLLGWSVN